MADGVHHTRIREDLNLNREDLGLDPAKYTDDQVEEIWQEITRSVRERDRELLLCVARANGQLCKAEHSGVKSPHMTVRKQHGLDGSLRWRAAHLPTAHQMTAEESDKHKATKDFVARTCDGAGLPYGVEKTTRTRTRRPDVTVHGKGGLSLGCEAQFYNASPGNVRTRSRDHAEAGLTANWITDNDTFHLVDRANYIIIPRYTWKQIDHAADLAATNGARVLVEWRCTAGGSGGRPCPEGKITRGGIIGTSGCGKVHLQWETPRLVDGDADDYGTMAAFTVGRIIVGAATGDMDSLFIPERKDRRSGRYLWVPSADKKAWMEYRGGEDLPEEDEDDLDDGMKFSGREIDQTCRYGEEGAKPGAPLPRRGVSSLGLTMTVDVPEEPADNAENDQPDDGNGPGRRTSRTVVLAAREVMPENVESAFDASGQPIPPCRICGKPASLRGQEGAPEHWSCRNSAKAPERAA